jgi:lipopolysaccharide transport system ATP-binding protein
MPPLLSFEHVDKRYRIGAASTSLREALVGVAKRAARKSRAPESDMIWALKDVNFSAESGDVIGVIGHNGAGKTTLLKLLSRVTHPTSGKVHVDGRVSALIELGAGFHPDLTGRENIYLNGVILGLTRKEIDRRFDSIVDFAELRTFIDTPVKRYSSGMYARLGFAVAAHTDPDLLVVDEVLGVGDQSFQQKCHEFIHSFVAGSKSALFVSHNLYVIEQLCTRLIWLDHGQVVMTGPPARVLPGYFDYMEERALQHRATTGGAGSRDLRISAVTVTDSLGNARDVFCPGEGIVVNVAYATRSPIERPHFCLAVVAPGGGQPLFGASMLVDGQAPPEICGEGVLRCAFGPIPLQPRVYEVWGEVWHADRHRALVDWHRLASFRVVDGAHVNGTPDDAGHAAGSIRHMRADAPVRVPYRWEQLDDTASIPRHSLDSATVAPRD